MPSWISEKHNKGSFSSKPLINATEQRYDSQYEICNQLVILLKFSTGVCVLLVFMCNNWWQTVCSASNAAWLHTALCFSEAPYFYSDRYTKILLELLPSQIYILKTNKQKKKRFKGLMNNWKDNLREKILKDSGCAYIVVHGGVSNGMQAVDGVRNSKHLNLASWLFHGHMASCQKYDINSM